MFAYTNSRPSSISTHQRDVSKPLVIQACLHNPCKPAPREKLLCFAGFETAITRLKWDICSSCPDNICQTVLYDVLWHYPDIIVLIMSPVLLQLKPWRAQSWICKSPPKKRNPFPSKIALSCLLFLMSSIFVHHNLYPPSSNIGVGKYLEAI